MKIKYEEAMETLQEMFKDFDKETIHSVLAMNSKGIFFKKKMKNTCGRGYYTN
jgi:oligoendopeptidase F